MQLSWAPKQEGPLPSSRSEAKAQKSKWYYTGLPCAKGHLSKRTTLGGQCVECYRAYRARPGYKEYANKKAREHRQTETWKSKVAARNATAKRHYYSKPHQYAFKRAKLRAKVKGLDFNIEPNDIPMTDVCPIFGIPFQTGHKDLSVSIDRIDSSKGYVKGNVAYIGRRANIIKNSGTAREHELIARWMRELGLE